MNDAQRVRVVCCAISQTHQSQCLVQDERFRLVDCDVFSANKPPTMALSTLVVIEMLNALNRSARRRGLATTHPPATAARDDVTRAPALRKTQKKTLKVANFCISNKNV